MDINGDRYPDIISSNAVQYSKPQGGLREYITPMSESYIDYSTYEASSTNVSPSFLKVKEIPGNSGKKATKSISGGSGSAISKDETTYTWIDMNGDGLPDKIYENGKISYNLGYSFTTPSDFGVSYAKKGESSSHNWSIGLGYDKDFNIANGSISGGLGGVRSENTAKILYMDMNGDGLPDRVEHKSDGRIYVSVNMGNSFLTEKTWSTFSSQLNQSTSCEGSINGAFTAGFSFWGIKFGVNPQAGVSWSVNKTNVQWMDMNNDGYPDMVSKEGSALKVRYAKPVPTGLLKWAKTPTSKYIIVSYQPTAKSTSESPSRSWEMKTLVERESQDGVDGVHSTYSDFEYKNRKYDRFEREDYGYDTVVTKQYNFIDESGVYNSAYRQLERIVENTYHNENYLFKGLMHRSTVKNASGSIFTEQEFNYKAKQISDGIVIGSEDAYCFGSGYPALDSERSLYYDLKEKAQLVTSKKYTHGSYGNVIRYENEGNIINPSDNISANITYHELTSNYIVGIPQQITYTASGSSHAYQRKSSIDPNTGALNQLNVNNVYYDYNYDPYGNRASVEGPANNAGQRMRIEYLYDPMLHRLPVEVKNNFGYVSSTSYDYQWGLPIETTDMGGAKMWYSYDDKGRLKTVRTEKDPVYTLKYEYWDEYAPSASNGNVSYVFKWAKTSHYDAENPGNPIDLYTFADGFGRVYQIKKDIEDHGTEKRQVSSIPLYDGLGRMIKSYYPVLDQDYQNSPMFFLAPGFAGNDFSDVPFTEYIYDSFDRLVETRHPDDSNEKKIYSIEDELFRTNIIDANGNTSVQYSDSRGLVIRNTSPEGGETWFNYDGLGQLLSSVDPDEHETIYEYDVFGRITKSIHPSFGLREWFYDNAGNLMKEINSLGRKEYVYDYNRLVRIDYPNMPENTVYYEYGAPGSGYNTGRLVKQQDATGVQSFKYGSLGE